MKDILLCYDMKLDVRKIGNLTTVKNRRCVILGDYIIIKTNKKIFF